MIRIILIFIATAIIITAITYFASILMADNFDCHHTPMDKMTDKQWVECLEAIQ